MSDRWNRIKEIFRGALDQPPDERDAYLARACGGDDELRAEVAALLAASDRADATTGMPLAAPAMTIDPTSNAPGAAARPAPRTEKVCPRCSGHFDADAVVCPHDGETLVDDPEALVNTTLDGTYRIERMLGRGGFGVVYLARHVLLRDLVAIKVLPRHLSSNPDRVERFMREGRTARALHHPNAVTVYDLRVSGGNFIYMVQEYVDGRTLRTEIDRRGRIAPAEAVKLLEPIASALDEAHSRGIVHRDLKPDNVMLGTVGGRQVVKLLDLGIAKLFEILSAPDTGANVTHPGQVIGTPAYMPPEQWGDTPDDGGPDIDGRADVYSLGVVVYEMVSGRKPFDATTANGLRRAHIAEAPHPLEEIVPGLPVAFSGAVERAMAKYRGDRQATAGELIAQLRAALEPSLDSTTEIQEGSELRRAVLRPPAAPRRPRAGTVLAALGVLVLVAAGALAWWLGSRAERPGPPTVRKLTHSGKALAAALSPDGRRAAVVVEEAGRHSLHLVQTATGNSARIVEPTEELLSGLTFSRDGDFVHFVREVDRRDNVLYRVPAVGGTPQKLLEGVESPVAFSPDGSRIAFMRRLEGSGGRAVFVASADGSGERMLALRAAPQFFTADGPSWSPDGRTIACSAGDHAGGFRGYVVGVDVETGAERLVTTTPWYYVDRVDWLDADSLAVSAADQPLGSLQLWRVDYASGEATRLTNDLNSYIGVSASADGRSLLSVQTSLLFDLWVARAGDPQSAVEVSSGTNRYFGVAWTPDGRLLYSSFEAGNPEIWISNADGSERRQLTFDPSIDRDPAMSSDGRHVYFSSNRAGAFNIWRMDADGENLVQVTRGDDEEYPSCTPDGRWLVYQAFLDGKTTVVKMSIETGETVRVAADNTYWPAVSPDGRWVACNQRDPQTGKYAGAVLSIDGSAPPRRFDVEILTMPRLQWQRIRWTPDGSGVTYIDDLGGRHEIVARPLDGGAPRRLTDFRSDQIFSYDVSRDGDIVCSRGPVASDVILISGL